MISAISCSATRSSCGPRSTLTSSRVPQLRARSRATWRGAEAGLVPSHSAPRGRLLFPERQSISASLLDLHHLLRVTITFDTPADYLLSRPVRIHFAPSASLRPFGILLRSQAL